MQTVSWLDVKLGARMFAKHPGPVARERHRPGGGSALERLSGGDVMGGLGHVLLPTVGGIMFIVGVLAAVGPARRGLAVHPIDALREE